VVLGFLDGIAIQDVKSARAAEAFLRVGGRLKTAPVPRAIELKLQLTGLEPGVAHDQKPPGVEACCFLPDLRQQANTVESVLWGIDHREFKANERGLGGLCGGALFVEPVGIDEAGGFIGWVLTDRGYKTGFFVQTDLRVRVACPLGHSTPSEGSAIPQKCGEGNSTSPDAWHGFTRDLLQPCVPRLWQTLDG
jgi:hypothetical protein